MLEVLEPIFFIAKKIQLPQTSHRLECTQPYYSESCTIPGFITGQIQVINHVLYIFIQA